MQLRYAFLTFLTAGLFYNVSLATHAGPNEIRYRWLNGRTYEITLTNYFSCTSGISIPSTASIQVQSLYATNFSVAIPRLFSAGPGIPPLQPTGMLRCMPASFNYCFEEYVYRGNVTLPSAAPDWIFSNSTNGLILSLNNVTNIADAYCAAGLNNLDFPDSIHQNSSPIWHDRRPNVPGHLTDTVINYPIVAVCGGNTIPMELGAIENDGDLLKYEFIPPRDGWGTIPMINGFTPAWPIPVIKTPPLTMDSMTGSMILRPMPVAPFGPLYYFGVKVTEYRNDTTFTPAPVVTPKEIGFSIRHMLFIFVPDSLCPDRPVQFAASYNPYPHTTEMFQNCSDSLINLFTTKKFLCSSADSNGSYLSITDSSTGLPVGITDQSTINCDHFNGTRNMMITTASKLAASGTYYLTYETGTDGNALIGECYTEVPPHSDTLTIHIGPEIQGMIKVFDTLTNHFSDTLYGVCNTSVIFIDLTEDAECSSVALNGSDFKLYQSSPPFHVSPILSATPVSCNNNLTRHIRIQLASPLPPGTYTLTTTRGNDGNSLLSKCEDDWHTSSISVLVSDFDFDLGPDTTVCDNQSFIFVLYAPTGYHAYQWNNDPNETNEYFYVSHPGTYFVRVQTPEGCVAWDTLTVNGVDCANSIVENAFETVSVFPNPASDHVIIAKPGNKQSMTIRFLSLSGIEMKLVVLPSNQEALKIQTSDLNSGLYLLELKMENGKSDFRKITIE